MHLTSRKLSARLTVHCVLALTSLSAGCNQADPEEETETGVQLTDPVPEPEPTVVETDPSSPATATQTQPTASAETDDDVGNGGAGGGEGQPPAPEPDGVLMNVAEYFPMADGASWTYKHIHLVNGEWVEEVSMSATTFEGEPAFIVTDSPDLSGEISVQTWQMTGSAISRVYREQLLDDAVVLSVTYDPGFARFDTSWNEVGVNTVNTYRREETQQDGTMSASIREQEFVVLQTDASVTVEAGTFDDCLVVERVRADNQTTKQFWFARGVGKVREEDQDTQTVEELTSFEIP